MTSEEIRTKFLKFFEDRTHSVVPSSSLVPEGDSSVLFTTAGMQQFKPYYIGKSDPEKDFNSKNTASIQKCVRTSDIEEVGDERHLTFFEMLGNFSFGGYWKKEAIQYAYDFVVKEMNLKIDYVTVFEGEPGVPQDKESEEIWKSIDPNLEVRKFARADNFWGPTGEEGPCGPTTEIYVDGIEIWNIVFNEFYQNKDKALQPLETKGIDTGMGLERLVKVAQKVPTVFETDLFDTFLLNIDIRDQRVVADHLRTAVFMLNDGVEASNKERGYILRRILRRAFAIEYKNKLSPQSFEDLIKAVIEKYKEFYPDLEQNKNNIINSYFAERQKFQEIIKKAEKELEKFEDKKISGKEMFDLATALGIPVELVENLGYEVEKTEFDLEMSKHQEISRAGMEQKFKGGLGGHSEMEVKYHTATHLLHQALRDVLGSHVEQRGSNITPERLRFDFSHPTKMTDEEKKKVEEIVNQKIKENLKVHKVVMSKEEAEQSGALHFFGDKYGDEVSIYYLGPSLAEAYSKEFCGGPHVSNTSELGTFKITKEEAVSAGIRRIKAILS